MEDKYLKLIQSNRVTRPTRGVLLDRTLQQFESYVPGYLSTAAFAVLHAVVDRLIPQKADSARVEIACVIDLRKKTNAGDGWRFADMPPDSIAVEKGLIALDATSRRLHGTDFASLEPSRQDDLLIKVQRGEVAWTELNARHWFEDLVAETTEIYVSHPSTLEQLGFSGIAFLPRWQTVGLDKEQSWEPTRR